MSNQRKFWPLTIMISAILLAFLAFNQWFTKPDLCSDILYLIEQSKSDFLAIRTDISTNARTVESSFFLPDTEDCTVFEDAAKSSYQCTWYFPLGDIEADAKFEMLATDIRTCIGDIAEEQLDQPVNHPDIYRSSYFLLPQGQLSLSLKNKSAFSSTLISIRMDAQP